MSYAHLDADDLDYEIRNTEAEIDRLCEYLEDLRQESDSRGEVDDDEPPTSVYVCRIAGHLLPPNTPNPITSPEAFKRWCARLTEPYSVVCERCGITRTDYPDGRRVYSHGRVLPDAARKALGWDDENDEND